MNICLKAIGLHPQNVLTILGWLINTIVCVWGGESYVTFLWLNLQQVLIIENNSRLAPKFYEIDHGFFCVSSLPLGGGPDANPGKPWNAINSLSCRSPCKLFIDDNLFKPLGLHLLEWSELGRLRPCQSMRDLRAGPHGSQVPSPKPLEFNMCNLNRWEHGSWDLPLYTGSQVLSPKYDMDAYMTTFFEGETGGLALRVGSSKKLDPTLNTLWR